MAEAEEQPKLGKRARDEDARDSPMEEVSSGAQNDDSDSDEVGPMPAPQGAPKKKRKGMCVRLGGRVWTP